ncbi:hypothetical protein P378_10515 [Desulforamulus profundi]|uniref:Uncharacterized protein n=1 Tax=Desulforamulus profundi TaxID=1383067 RepID=A0A2C6MFV3_9FIRM|nr:hypothetical protein P378_10515 [Desulforamulus profundi]
MGPILKYFHNWSCSEFFIYQAGIYVDLLNWSTIDCKEIYEMAPDTLKAIKQKGLRVPHTAPILIFCGRVIWRRGFI